LRSQPHEANIATVPLSIEHTCIVPYCHLVALDVSRISTVIANQLAARETATASTRAAQQTQGKVGSMQYSRNTYESRYAYTPTRRTIRSREERASLRLDNARIMCTAERLLALQRATHVPYAPANTPLMQTAGKPRLSYTVTVLRDLRDYDAVKCAMRAIVPTPPSVRPRRVTWSLTPSALATTI
jgi:hypothetical protein